MKILAIDPGTDKCGLAIVGLDEGIILREVISRDSLKDRIIHLISEYKADQILLGSGTGSSKAHCDLNTTQVPIPIKLVDESYTTLLARKRYFKEHPPRGIWRLIPTSLQNPREPVDDYVAVILAERWLHRNDTR